jgi:hypothetical protein
MEFTDDGALFKGINALRERGREWFQYFFLVERSNKRQILQLNVPLSGAIHLVEHSTKRTIYGVEYVTKAMKYRCVSQSGSDCFVTFWWAEAVR